MTYRISLSILASGTLLLACSGTNPGNVSTAAGGNPNSGGATLQGGQSWTGGVSSGGSVASGGTIASGGAPSFGGASGNGGTLESGGGTANGGTSGIFVSGGTVANGGAATGGSASGGKAAGGAANGGAATGGKAAGGAANGGAATGGKAAGGAASGGAATGGTSAGAGSSNCGTHSWACWPMPNPVSMGLPNPASYTDLGDGTVRDNVTGLVWQRTISAPADTWDNSKAYCTGLSLAGGGWRMPMRIEIQSIIDHTRTSPAISVTAFPSTPTGFYWSGSPWAVTAPPARSWGTNFYEGLSSNNVTNSGLNRVRCVRGNGDGDLPATPPPNQYTLVATGEVQDNYTRLIWEQATHQPAMAYDAAVALCGSLALNGHSFRLPTVNELSTLVDDTRVAPAINRTMFPDTVWGSGDQYYYWAQNAWAGSTAGTGWGLNYNDGYTGHGRTSLVVRCVRK